MRKLCVLLTCVSVGLVTGICPAADPVSADVTYPDSGYGIAQVQDDPCASECTACTGSECGCGRCGLRGCRAGHVNRKAQIGYFNCNCRGSYKFPVPPQYTYFWPGMYSQQTMTEYASPWRFPPLKPLPDDLAAKQSDVPRLIVTVEGLKKPKPVVARELKRLTRTK